MSDKPVHEYSKEDWEKVSQVMMGIPSYIQSITAEMNTDGKNWYFHITVPRDDDEAMQWSRQLTDFIRTGNPYVRESKQ